MHRIITPLSLVLQILLVIVFPQQIVEAQANTDKRELAEYKTSLQRQIQVTQRQWTVARTVAVTSDGQIIISGDDEGQVKLWEIKTGRLILTLPKHSNWVQSVVISPDGKIIASGSVDGTIKLWNFNGQLLSTLKNTSAVYSLFWSSDGKIIASGGGDGKIKLWNVQGKLIRTIKAHSGNVVSIVISPNLNIIASRSFYDIKTYEEIKFWNLKTGNLLRSFNSSPVGGVNSLAISQSGSLLAGYQNNGRSRRQLGEQNSPPETVTIWRLPTGEGVNTFNVGIERPHAVAFSPDGKTLAVGGLSNQVQIWSISKNEKIATLASPHHTYSLTFSRDGKTLISSGARNGGSIVVWSID